MAVPAMTEFIYSPRGGRPCHDGVFSGETRSARRCTENPDASVKSPCAPCLRGEVFTAHGAVFSTVPSPGPGNGEYVAEFMKPCTKIAGHGNRLADHRFGPAGNSVSTLQGLGRSPGEHH